MKTKRLTIYMFSCAMYMKLKTMNNKRKEKHHDKSNYNKH